MMYKNSKKIILKWVLLITFFGAFFSCTKNKDEDLKLEVINTEILSRGNINEKYFKDYSDYRNYVYDSMAVNKINIKITNPEKKTYIMYLNKTIQNSNEDWRQNVLYNIYNSKNTLQKSTGYEIASETMNAYSSRRYMNEKVSDSLNKELYQIQYKDTTGLYKLKYDRLFNYVIIHPNETKLLSYYNTLPYIRFKNPIYSIYNLNKNEKYTFEVVINNDAKKIEKYLSENLKKEIKENNYVIFNGVIKSNKVPIKFISM